MITVGHDPGRCSGLTALDDAHEVLFAIKVKAIGGDRHDAESLRAHVDAILAALAVRGIPPSRVGKFAFEVPQFYAGTKRKGDQNDLAPLIGLGYMLAGSLPRSTQLVAYKPVEWKGGVEVNPMCRRIVGRLTDAERLRVQNLDKFLEQLAKAEARGREVEGEEHNTIDGLGVALKAAGRLERVRVIAR